MLWTVIMAGGSGTRFWPASRKNNPKQFLSFFNEKTLLQETFTRVKKDIHPSRIIIFTQKTKVSYVVKSLGISRSQVIGEPIGRNTAPCATWAASYIYKKDPKGVMVLLPADHIVKDTKAFSKAMLTAYKVADSSEMPVTLGIKPTSPHTGYGYLEMGPKKEQKGDLSVFQLKNYLEKPNLEKAKKYIKTKRFLWNAGIFVWRVDAMLQAVKKHLPAVYDGVIQITSSKVSIKKKEQIFKEMPSVSIDYGLMEKLKGKILTIPVSMEWNDVGSWSTLSGLLKSDTDGNVLSGKTLICDSKDNFVKSNDKLIAMIGVNDYVVVESKDVILICPKTKTESIRKLVLELEKQKLSQYL